MSLFDDENQGGRKNKALLMLGLCAGLGLMVTQVLAQDGAPEPKAKPKPRYVDQQYDPEPYYVDGVEYKPYVPDAQKTG